MSAPTKVIRGRTFSFGTMPATRAVPIAVEVGPILGDALAAFAKAQATDDGGAATFQVAGLLLRETATNDWKTPDGRERLGLLSIMREVFAFVTCDGKPVNLDVTFTGKLGLAAQVLVEALKVNFADFFPESPSASNADPPPGA